MSRLQTSRYVAARVLAPSTEAFDTPLGPPRSLAVPGVCYAALRDLPRRDLHPLETNSVKRTVMHPLRHDTLQRSFYRWMGGGSSGCTELPPPGARAHCQRVSQAGWGQIDVAATRGCRGVRAVWHFQCDELHSPHVKWVVTVTDQNIGRTSDTEPRGESLRLHSVSQDGQRRTRRDS